MKCLVIDTETTGLNPNIHSMIQIAAVVYDNNGNEISTFNQKCASASLVSMGALKVNNQSLNEIRKPSKERLGSEVELIMQFLDWKLEQKL